MGSSGSGCQGMFRVVVSWLSTGVIQNTNVKERTCIFSCVWISTRTQGCFTGRSKFNLLNWCHTLTRALLESEHEDVGGLCSTGRRSLSVHVNNVWEIFVNLCLLHKFFSVRWCLRMLEALLRGVTLVAIFPVYFLVFYTTRGPGAGRPVRSKSVVFPHQVRPKSYCTCFQVVCLGRPYGHDSWKKPVRGFPHTSHKWPRWVKDELITFWTSWARRCFILSNLWLL